MPRDTHSTTLRIITAVFCLAGIGLISGGLVAGLPLITALGAICAVTATVNLAWAVAADAHTVAVAAHDRLDRAVERVTTQVEHVDRRVDRLTADIDTAASQGVGPARRGAA